MSQGRDWRKALYPASFKGVPFQTERDEETGGRRIVSHEFPMRDTPFNEDLGEAKRDFEVTAYLASNRVDSQASALAAVCAQRGPGLLVLPMQGGIMVRLINFRRAREKDKAGYVAFSLSFTREGAAFALVSFGSLANLVFAASDRLAAAVDDFLTGSLAVLGMPGFVVDAVVDAIVDGAAIFEAVRLGEAVDPLVSAAQRVALARIVDMAITSVTASAGYTGTAGADLVAVARALSDGLPPLIAARSFGEIVAEVSEPPTGLNLSPAARRAADNTRSVYLAIRLAAACAYTDAIAQADIPDRQTAIALRANAAGYFEKMLHEMAASDAEIYRATTDLLGATVEYLSRAILDRAPVVTVGANRRMPSLWWAHRLYADAGRATDLVARNRVAHPSFMPTEFDAVMK